jgi:hypothetical protein
MKKTTSKENIKAKNYVFPTPDNMPTGAKAEKNLRSYITPVQLQRLRHDIQMWRDAIKEAEQAWYPHRVRMQRMFIDTILNGHTLACVNRRKDLTLLREYSFKNEAGAENKELKKLFSKAWFARFVEYTLEARFFGYSLIALGDLVGDEFPTLDIIRRFNVSPDRLNVTSYVYSLSGAQFLEEPYAPWHVWVTTQSDIGVSKVGYGLLYSVAMYEILCRNLLGNNADASELYGMPVRKGKTSKTEEDERSKFAQALQEMGSAGWILVDEFDDVELVESKGNGQGFKIYADLEKRLENKISKLILGHADALDSTPGKLGGGQGGEDSPAGQALRDKQTSDGTFVENIVNGTLIPKMIELGFNIDTTYPFKFSNNQEVVEKRMHEDANNKVTADIAKTMKDAGLKMDAKYFEERTGIKTTELEEPAPVPPLQLPKKNPLTEKVKNKLEQLYK